MEKLSKDLMRLVNINDVYLKHDGGGLFSVVDGRLQVIVFSGSADECTGWMFDNGKSFADFDVQFKVQYYSGSSWVDQFGTTGISYKEAVEYVNHAVKFTDKAWRVLQVTFTSVYEQVKE